MIIEYKRWDGNNTPLLLGSDRLVKIRIDDIVVQPTGTVHTAINTRRINLRLFHRILNTFFVGKCIRVLATFLLMIQYIFPIHIMLVPALAGRIMIRQTVLKDTGPT
jgi:hypothetical protein